MDKTRRQTQLANRLQLAREQLVLAVPEHLLNFENIQIVFRQICLVTDAVELLVTFQPASVFPFINLVPESTLS